MLSALCYVLAWCSNIEPICYSETSVDLQRNTGHYVPEDRTLHMDNSMGTCFNNGAIYAELLKLTVEHMPNLMMIDAFMMEPSTGNC
jgi:hypothetical protein